jgi:nitrogen-specific signal transduction histidine kinase
MSEPSKNNGNFGMSASGGHSPAAKSDLSLPDTNWLDAGAAILDNEGKVKKANLELENWLAIENAKIINRPLNELIKIVAVYANLNSPI